MEWTRVCTEARGLVSTNASASSSEVSPHQSGGISPHALDLFSTALKKKTSPCVAQTKSNSTHRYSFV